MKEKLSLSLLFLTVLILISFFLIATSVITTSYEDLLITPPGEYEITPDGKHVYTNTPKVFIMAPAELHGSGYTYLNFTAKQFSGNIDLAVGFDTTHIKPKSAEFYKPHYDNYTTDYTIYNVTGNFYERTTEELDVGNEYNSLQYVIEYYNPNYNYSECDSLFEDCIPDNYTIETLVVAFDSIVPSPPIIEGNNYTITYHTERIENWMDITNRLSVLPESIHNNYDDKNKWYYVKDQPITEGVEYQIRIDVEAPPQLGEHSYKYDVVIKPSSQTFAQANAAGNLFILDPYWNTSFSNRELITITTNGTSTPANYQILLNITYESEMQADFDDIRFTNSSDGELSYWIESKVDSNYANVWVNLLDAITDPGSDTIWMYYGNDGLSDGGVGDDTFEFFDDFSGVQIKGTFLTDLTKSVSNPLQDKTSQNWFITVYSNYNNEDKIYIFENRNYHPSNTIQAWSFTRANASTPAQWTDHGVVFTGVAAHDGGHIEPHGIIFETQSMSDAREGVGVGEGTPKWRLYYCAKGDGEGLEKYSANFAYASESNLTNWTAYASNPVYDHDAEWGYADSKVCIYDNKVWMHHCKYKSGVSCVPSFFSVSDNGIDTWTDKTTDWSSVEAVVGTLVPFSNGILITGRGGSKINYNAFFTTDGDDKGTYSGNPIIPQGGAGDFDDTYVSWASIIVDKNGSADLNSDGTYYMYYIGDGGATTYKLGLATSTTLTEEDETIINNTKWIYSGAALSGGVININADTEYLRSIDTFQYGYAVKSKMRINTYANYGAFGFKTGVDTNSINQSSFWIDATPRIRVVVDNPDAGSEYIVDLGNMGTDWRTYEIIRYAAGGKLEYFVNDGDTSTGSTTDVNSIPTGVLPVQLHAITGNPSIDLDWIFVRNFISDNPLVSYGSPQYPTDSLHYNSTSPYNHTIESDGTITANRTIIPADDTNDTAQSTGTSYLILNSYDNEASIVRNFTFTGDNLNWYQIANISGTYDLKNSTGIIETQSDGNFTTDLVAGTYWIEDASLEPFYSNVAHNNTTPGSETLFSVYIDCNEDLHPNGQYIFATNNTGSWVNDSAVNFTSTGEWANVTKDLSSTPHTIIGYRWYADNNDGNSSASLIYTLTTAYNSITLTPTTHAVFGHYEANFLLENQYSTGFVPADIDFYTEMTSTQYIALSTDDDSFAVSVGDNQDDAYLYVNFSVDNVTSIDSFNITIVGTCDENWYMGAYNDVTDKWDTMDSSTETTEITMNYLVEGAEVATYSELVGETATFSIALWESDSAAGTVSGDLISVEFYYETITDTDPSYSGASTNNTLAGGSCAFSIDYDDNEALESKGQYIFSTNNTGVWVNESLVNFTSTPETIETIKTLNSTVGLSIGYRWYADDDDGNINDTPIYTLNTSVALEHIPPDPISLANTTGNFWVNYTWSPGSGNVTDSYNVSYNGTWDNTSSNTFRNESVGAHGSLDIIIYAYNNTGDDLSSGNLTDSVTVPNNVPVLSDVSPSYNVYENETFSLDASHTDLDSDTITYSDNSSEWNINSATGEVSWVLDWEDVAGSPYAYRITIDDGEGGTDYQDFTVTINGVQNTALTSVDTSFENGLPGTDFADNTITLSFYLINSGSIDADISAKFITNYDTTYGLVSGTSTIGGSNFKLGNATLNALLDNGNSVDLTDDVPGEVTQRNYEVQVRVPAGQNALSYSGTVELTFSDVT